MRRIIAVIDNDMNYAGRLADYFNSRDIGSLKAIAYSSADKARADRNHEISVVLAHEDDMSGFDCPVVVVSEDGLCGNYQHAIHKYTQADNILREVLSAYADGKDNRLMRVTGSGSRLWGIFSPVGRCGKTSFAITIAMRLSQNGKVLLISFDEFSPLLDGNSRDTVAGLSDIIYSYMKGEYSWSRLSRAVYPFGHIDYIPPIRCPDDLDGISGEQLCELLLQISRESGYDDIVLDLGLMGRKVTDIADICPKLYMPCPEDPLSDMKCRAYFDSIRDAGREEGERRFQRIVLPVIDTSELIKKKPEAYTKGKLWEAACDLVEGKVNCLEDDWADRWMSV